MKLSIFINYFNPAYIFQNRYLIPIQVGKALATEDLRILGDDAADENISTKNPQFCELTGQYYVWKNVPDLDYYGFVHYRRFFDFTESPNRSIDVHGVIVEAAASDAVLSEYGLDEVTLENAIRGFDLILPHPYDVAQAGAKSVREQYLTAPHHFIEDLDEAERVIAEKSPAFSPFFRRTMEGRLLYPNNMFVMRASIFREYSAWLFDVLFELERRIDVRGRTWQEKRAIGYIAERLFSVYAMKLRHDEEIKTKYLHRVFIANAAPPPTGPELPDSSLPVVTVAASTDNAYVQHMSALIASVLSTASPRCFIDFIVLDGGITKSDRRGLAELTKLHPHCRISFVDMSKQHLELSVNSYFTRGTFYRLSLPNILSDRDKVLFLDTDMVVLKDVTVLYEQELGDALLAAVPDLIMRSFVGLGVAAIGEVGGLRAARYISDRIGLKCSADYFQAGVLLMNLAQMRRTCLSDRMTHALRTERFWFLDQDVLNKFARGQVIYLDFRWNSVYMDQYHLDALDKDDCVSYMKTLDDPWIVHYAGINKPWQQAGHPHATHYWCALRLTRWYEIALFAFLAPGEGKEQVVVRPGGLYRKSISLWIVRKMWRALPQSVRRTLMPIGDAVKKRVALEM